ncbi:hypothetical protein J14TS2_00850 [Bacillus sp. J14TS2]|uniref:hypothetical protein n=1 Tax=Bacillus sp. J14TS2 TaxID=2807188 RepID=UPI001B18F415|nr:hypothetical protein [Bacillus sp. J14TS2]GIN69610.1 hypothetical protein J14TS2_00850 [Bacillus sp. J14TS2]
MASKPFTATVDEDLQKALKNHALEKMNDILEAFTSNYKKSIISYKRASKRGIRPS